MKKLNNKGFTLIELLAVIVVISLILGLSAYGIISSYNKSKEKTISLSETSIMEAARIYSGEANVDEWRELDTDSSNNYFCTTIQRLKNAGLLKKEATSINHDDSQLIAVSRNKTTFAINNTSFLEDTDDLYELCGRYIKFFTIVYDANGGKYNGPEKQKGEVGTSIDLTSVKPTRKGYSFSGWNTKADGSGSAYNSGSSFYSDEEVTYTLYAKWVKAKAEFIFNTNGGNIGSSPTIYSGTTYYWNVDSNGDISRSSNGGNSYTKKFFSINYNDQIAANGLPNYNNASYMNITKTGYHAQANKEWYRIQNTRKIMYSQSNSNYTSSDFCDASSSDCTVTLFVNWEPNTYTIEFNGNGSTSGSMSSLSMTYDMSKSLSRNSFSRNGYSFNGWSTKADGSGNSYGDGETVENLTDVNNGSVTLYAVWRVNKVNFIFNTNGGTVTSHTNYYWTVDSSGKVLRSSDEGMPYDKYFYSLDYNGKTDQNGLPNYNDASYMNITKRGYHAADDNEWMMKKQETVSGSSEWKYYNQDNVYNASDFCDASSSDCTVTLSVNWEPNTYTIKFDGNGATFGNMSDMSMEYNVSKTLPDNLFSKRGSNFSGWNTEADGTGIYYSDKESVNNLTDVNNGSVTLYAQWSGKPYWTVSDGVISGNWHSGEFNLSLNCNNCGTLEYRDGTSGTWTEYTGPISISSDGTKNYQGRIKDASSSVTYVSKLDTTPPTVTFAMRNSNTNAVVSNSYYSLNGSSNNLSWLNFTPMLIFDASDSGSGVEGTATNYWNSAYLNDLDETIAGSYLMNGTRNADDGTVRFDMQINADGYRHIEVEICDNIGNCETTNVNFKFDNGVPSITYDSYKNSWINYSCDGSVSGLKSLKSVDEGGGTAEKSGGEETLNIDAMHWWSNHKKLTLTCTNYAGNSDTMTIEYVKFTSSTTSTYCGYSTKYYYIGDLAASGTTNLCSSTETACNGVHKYQSCKGVPTSYCGKSDGRCISYREYGWKTKTSTASTYKIKVTTHDGNVIYYDL